MLAAAEPFRGHFHTVGEEGVTVVLDGRDGTGMGLRGTSGLVNSVHGRKVGMVTPTRAVCSERQPPGGVRLLLRLFLPVDRPFDGGPHLPSSYAN